MEPQAGDAEEMDYYFFLVVAFFVVFFAAFLAGAFFAMALLPPFCATNLEASTFTVNGFF